MKRASYREAIDWIAQNDSAGDSDANNEEAAAYLVSSVLVAEIFGVECERVGRDVVRRRLKLGTVIPREEDKGFRMLLGQP